MFVMVEHVIHRCLVWIWSWSMHFMIMATPYVCDG